MLADIIDYARGLWGRASVKFLVSSLTFGTAFTSGYVSEMGYGLYAVVSEAKLLTMIGFYAATFWLGLRLFQLMITASRAVVIMGLRNTRDFLKWLPPARWLLYWPLRLRFRLRHHVWLYNAAIWALVALFVVTSITTTTSSGAGEEVFLRRAGSLAGYVGALAVFGFSSLLTYGLSEVLRGVPRTRVSTAGRPPTSFGFRLALQTFFVPLTLLMAFLSADALGRFYVALVKYSTPSVSLKLRGAGAVPGAILMSTGEGMIFFPADTHLGTFLPIESIEKIETLSAPADGG